MNSNGFHAESSTVGFFRIHDPRIADEKFSGSPIAASLWTKFCQAIGTSGSGQSIETDRERERERALHVCFLSCSNMWTTLTSLSGNLMEKRARTVA